jgi:glutamate--glyoxylate aminotransferase
MLLFCEHRVFHHWTTILTAEEYVPTIISSFKKFNDSFMEQYEGYSRMWCEHEK